MSWFGKTKSTRKPNLAENLLASTQAAADTRKRCITDFTQILIDHIAQELINFAKVERNPSSTEFRLLDFFYGEKRSQVLIDKFLKGTIVPLPTGDELNELIPVIKTTLEEPTRYGLVVAADSSKLRVIWTNPTVPTEPTREEPAPVIEQKSEINDEEEKESTTSQ
jgi:hypothetical protein